MNRAPAPGRVPGAAGPSPRRGAVAANPLAAAALVVVLVLALEACSTAPAATPGLMEGPSIGAPATGSPGPADAVPASPVTGVLVKIEAAGLTDVTGFSLRLDDGRVIAFRIGTLENGDQFPPGHLAEHMATSLPVRVFFRANGTDLVVYRLEDAP